MRETKGIELGVVGLWIGLMGCAGDEGSGGNGGTSAGPEVDGGATITRSYELVQATRPDMPIVEPLEVFVYDADTGLELEPPVRATARAGAGTFEVTYPSDVRMALYVVGNSAAEQAPYDSIYVDQPGAVFDPRIRMSSVFTAQVVFDGAKIESREDAVAMAGTIYWSPGGERKGVVGCAQVLLDDDTTGLDVDSDQRYVGSNAVPVPSEAQTHTDPVQGSFYFGNLGKGPHRMRAVLDGGATVLGEISVPIAFTREEARGPSGLVFYTSAFDIDVPENPTPDGCTP